MMNAAAVEEEQQEKEDEQDSEQEQDDEREQEDATHGEPIIEPHQLSFQVVGQIRSEEDSLLAVLRLCQLLGYTLVLTDKQYYLLNEYTDWPKWTTEEDALAEVHKQMVTQPELCKFFRRCLSLAQQVSSTGQEAAFQSICCRVSNYLQMKRKCACTFMTAIAASSAVTSSAKFTFEAFRSDFKKGKHLALIYRQVEIVCGLIEEIEDTYEFYSPTVTIYQHSCSGKTKSVIELALNIFPMLYICFREQGARGYPSTAETKLRHYLLYGERTESLLTATPLAVYLRYAAFMIASMITFHQFWADVSVDSASSKEERDALLREKLSVFLNVQLQGSMNSHSDSSLLLNELCSQSEGLETMLLAIEDIQTCYHTSNGWDWKSIEDKVLDAACGILQQNEVAVLPKDRVIGAICVDEESIFGRWHTEGVVGGKREKQSLSIHMLRASRLLFSIMEYPCSMLRMDTTSEIDLFRIESELKYDNSSRSAPEGIHNCVYSLISARNLGADEIETETNLIKTVNTVSYLTRFGCPLWNSACTAGGNTAVRANDGGFLVSLKKLVKEKLRGGRRATLDATEPREYSAALFGATVYTNVIPYFMASRKLVASHMAQLEYWFPAQNICKVGYPPDPVLAAVAYDALVKPAGFGIHVKNLGAIMDTETVSSGDVAELVARLLILMATHQPVTAMGEADTPEAMSVLTFLSNLVDKHDKRDPDDLQSTLKDLCGERAASILEGVVHLRQFVPTETDISREDVCLAAKRGFGFICKRNQVGMDLLIPVILKRPIANFASILDPPFAPSASDPASAPVAASVSAPATSSSAATTSGSIKRPLVAVSAPSETGSEEPQSHEVIVAVGDDATSGHTRTGSSKKRRTTLRGTTAAAEHVGAPVETGEEAIGATVASHERGPSGAFLKSLSQSLHSDEAKWVAKNGKGLTFEDIQSINTDPSELERNKVTFHLLPKATLKRNHQFSPEYVSYIMVQVKYRSSSMPGFVLQDPLSVLEPALDTALKSVMPRMGIGMVFEQLQSSISAVSATATATATTAAAASSGGDASAVSPGTAAGYSVDPAPMRTRATSASPSLFVPLRVTNPHLLLKPCYVQPLEDLLERLATQVPYEKLATPTNAFSVLRRPKVAGTENRPIANTVQQQRR